MNRVRVPVNGGTSSLANPRVLRIDDLPIQPTHRTLPQAGVPAGGRRLDKRRSSVGLTVLALALGLPGVLSAQTPVSSTFQLGVWADANQNVAGNAQDFYTTSQGATLNPFSHSLSVTDLDSANGGSLRVTSSASASWTSAAQGSVAWRGMGWIHDTFTSSGSKLNGFVIPGPAWSYTFQASANGFFSMAYDVRGTGNVFGLLGAVIQWSGPGGNLDLTNPYNPAATGVFTRSLTAGTTYTVGLYNGGNVFTAPIRRTDSGMMDADFAWQIGAVPEPSTIAVMGFAAAALLRRRRR